MSIHINSDKEKFQGSKPKLVGNDELTVRGGTGSLEKEILRTQLDANTGLPRVGINRTGQRVNDVKILTGGSGYISPPTITIDPPIGGGVQAQGSAFIFNGQVVSIAVNDPGSGYSQSPAVTIQGGGGVGASAEALLDTVDFELDINGAIRTSTSIISDTARILNLDIDNFVTPNAAFRAPSLKTFINNSGTLWSSGIILQENAYRYFGQNVYQALNSGQTGSDAPVHTDGEALNGEVNFKHIGFRVVDQNEYGYSETGPSGEFPRSITPLLGDRSDKIATTEYVLNLATNDVGGRIYVSQTIGSDLNDGRSAVNPVRSIKKAAQLAWATPGVKETLIVSGGDYVEDNPISLPPDASVVGDNLRLVIIRPANPNKHIFKFGDKNYVTGVTYRDKIDSNGDAVATWDYAMVFDDKQRILVDADANGDFGTDFPIGHQIFGPQQFRVTFQNNTGLSTLVSGLKVVGVNTGSRAVIQSVIFDTQIGASAYISGTLDITLDSGSFVEGEQFNYVTSITHNVGSPLSLTSTGTTAANKITFSTDPTAVTPAGTYVYLSDVGNATFTPAAGYYEVTQIEPNDINNPTSWEVSYLPILGATGWTAVQSASIEVFTGNAQVETLNTTKLKSIRAEGEVVSVDTDYNTSLPISRLDFSLQGDPSITQNGFQSDQFGNAEDLGGIVFYTNALVGRTNTHEFKEGQEILIEGLPTSNPDLSFLNGRQRIYKVLEDADGRCRRFVIPKKAPSLTDAEFDPGQFAIVKTATKSITLSLLNSPNTFPISTPVDRRFQDACTFLRNNRDFIADEVVGKINDQFARYFYSAYNISGNSFDIFVGLAEQSHTYISGGTVKFGGTTYNVSNFVYSNAVTGVATVTTDNPVAGLNEDDHIKLEGMTLECDAGQKVYPSYSSPSASGSDGDSQCKEDIVHFINAIIRDLEFGSNHNVIEAAQKYIVGGKITYIEDEIIQNVRAIEYARELAIYCMRNWRTGNGTVNDPIYTPVYSSLPRYFDDTVITLTAGTPACANVASAIDTLAFLWADVITNNSSGTYLDAAYLISRNKDLIADQALIDTESLYPTLNLSDTNQRKCRRDIRIVLDGLVKDLVLGGNNGIVTVAESYFTGVQLTGIAEAQRPSTLYAFQRAKLYALEAMRNWSGGGVNSVTPVGAIYNSTTGSLNVTYPVSASGIPQVGDRIAFTEGAITFSCDMGGGAANHASPDRFDSNYGQSYEITSVTGTTFISVNCNVGDAGTAAGIAHTFASAKTNGTIIIYDPTAVTSTIPKFEDWNILLDATAGQPSGFFTPTNATYDPSNGDFTITVGAGHGVTTANSLRLDTESFVFTCAMDGNQSTHSLPQSGQPAYETSVAVTATTTDTITVNVGASGPDVQFTPTDGSYDPATGELQLTIGIHSLSVGEGVMIADNSLTFTCTQDNNATEHTYPRPGTDPFAGMSMPIIAKSDTSITVNAGASPAGQQYPHTWVSATANAVSHLPQSAHTFVSAGTNSVTVYTTGSEPLCASVATSINTIMGLFEDILDETVSSGTTVKTFGTLFDPALILTYPDNFVTDSNNNRLSIRGDYDDFPIIEASPYTQNASVISFLGGGGAEVDGAKVKQPNSPFPGLELDGSASFPNQGKSMVAAAFTIVSFGGTGYHVINDGYTQLVSVFVIFCADGVLAESGGYCSITNSATNFGQYALRGIGFREDPYSFDIATISNVSSTPTGRTILTVTGLGREPLEHYVGKVDGYRNTNSDIEYFVDVVAAVTVGPPFSAQLTFDDGTGGAMDLTDNATDQAVSTGALLGKTINLHRPSIVNSSSHTWEFAGSGTNYLALPENGGTKIEAFEQVSEQYGRVYVSGTDELGDFKVGTFARIENRTGNITFTGTVTISEVEFLKLKGGDVVVTGFDASNTLGGATATDSKLPTQKAVRDYITNNLGPFINKPYSTNAVPRALVELTDSGKISIDQIPALRPFSVFTVANQAERTSIEGALAGDIAIQQDTSTSFILNNDNDSLFLGFAVDPALSFTIGDVFTGSISTGRIQSTEYRTGIVYQINVTNGGSGYVTPPVITFAGGNPEAGAVSAAATCTIANGTVVTVTIIEFNGFKGGKGYGSAPTVTFAAPPGAGTQAIGNALIESRLYGNIVNNIKIEDTDTINDSTSPTPNTVNINRSINTSSFNSNNWVSLSSNQIAASDITSGVIETDRLASGGAANSFTFLRGDQNFALAMQSIKGAERRYFAKLAAQCNSGSSQMIFTTNSDVLIGHEVKNNVAGVQNNTNISGVITSAGLTTISLNNPVTQNIPINTIIEFERGASPMTFESTYTLGGFVDDVIIANGGSGYTNGQYFDVELQGGTGTGLKANIVVAANTVTELTVTDGGSGYNADYSITVSPAEIGAGSSLVLNAKVSTVNRQYANVAIDITRVSDLTISADLYGTIGVSRYKKAQFNIGQAGNGSVELKTGPDSGLDADLLDGQQGNYYTSATNLFSGTVPSDRLNGTYNIDVSGSSNNTIRLQTGTNNPTSNPNPNSFVEGAIANTVFNSSNGLGSAYPSVNTGIGSGTSTKHLVLTLRNGASGFDASFGGVRQLAFANDDNMYIRGSGNGVSTWNSWARVWSSLNDGVDSGLDADRLDNRQGTWYQDALNINYGTLSDNRLPRFISETKFRDKITIKSFSGDPKYRIYVSGQILNTAPFIPGDPNNPSINLYNANAQGVGSFVLDNVITNDDLTDNFNDYTILIGRLTSGNFVGALTVGTASNRVEFDDFTIEDGNTVEVANFQSNGGVAELQLGRKDGNTSSPAILFNSSQVSADFNAKIEASGGNATDGSGALNVSVVNADAFTINNQVIWNAGNILFGSANVANYAVQRDANGDFAAGTITANLTGASSLNVLKTGDTMTGSLVLTGATSGLTVSGNSNFNATVNIADDLSVDSGVLFVDVSANEVGINSTNPVATLDVVGDLGIFVRTSTDNAGAQIRFSDQTSAAQNGTIKYYHGDTYTPNSQYNEAFCIEGTETKLALKVVGDVIATRRMGVGLTREPNFTFEVAGNGCFNSGLTIDQANDNSGAPISFRGASSYRNFRVGNQLVGNHLFTIQASTDNGGTTWNGTPAISVKGDVNAVSINTTSTSGVDPESNTTRNYKFNVQGDMNINGQFFQNNAEFVTSRWTEATNNLDIYRISKVGVNKVDPVYQLDVSGDIQVANGTLYSNGVKQWLDSYGIFKSNSNTVSENVTVPANVNCVSAGPITIATGYTVTINSGGNWAIV